LITNNWCWRIFFKRKKTFRGSVELGLCWCAQVFRVVRSEQAPQTASRDPVTSQPPVGDDAPRRPDDLGDVTENVTASRDRTLESAPERGCAAENFEICEIAGDDVTGSEMATGDVIAHEQSLTTDQQLDQSQQQQQQQQLQQNVRTETPATSSPTSSSSSTVTATVARQQSTQQPTSSTTTTATTTTTTTTTTVDSVDQARGKRRHKDDKSKTAEQEAEVPFGC